MNQYGLITYFNIAYNSAKSPEPYGVFSDEEMGRAGDDYTGDARSERSMTEFDEDFNHDLSVSSVSATEYVDYEETKKNLQDWDIDTLLKDVGVTNKNNNNNNNSNNNGPGQLTLKKKMSQKVINSLGTVMQVENEEEKLPVLASWMEKRRPKPPYVYQKRFVCVIDGHLLWNDKKVKVRPGYVNNILILIYVVLYMLCYIYLDKEWIVLNVKNLVEIYH